MDIDQSNHPRKRVPLLKVLLQFYKRKLEENPVLTKAITR